MKVELFVLTTAMQELGVGGCRACLGHEKYKKSSGKIGREGLKGGSPQTNAKKNRNFKAASQQ